jgi:hypothetical protein
MAFAPGLAGQVQGLAGLAFAPGLAGLTPGAGGGMMGFAPGYAGLAAQQPGMASQSFRVYIPSLAGPVAMDVVK